MDKLKERITKVSIDRLTVIGSIIDTQAFQRNVINDYNITEKLLPYSPNTGYHQSLKLVEGLGHIDIDNREDIVRYEYNPNTVAPSQKFYVELIINQLKNIVFSRVDIATDFNLDGFNDFDFQCTRPVSETHFLGTTKKIQTKYYGARNSDMFYRLYDKTIEQQEKGKVDVPQAWWRLEVQLNNKRIVDDFLYNEFTPFYDMIVGRYEGFDESFFSKCKNMKDFLFFKEVYIHRNYLDRLSRREKEGFNKMKKEYEEIVYKDYIIIGSLIQNELNTIRKQLQNMINEHNIFTIDFAR
jgi:hypothetical protein